MPGDHKAIDQKIYIFYLHIPSTSNLPSITIKYMEITNNTCLLGLGLIGLLLFFLIAISFSDSALDNSVSCVTSILASKSLSTLDNLFNRYIIIDYTVYISVSRLLSTLDNLYIRYISIDYTVYISVSRLLSTLDNLYIR